MVCEKKISVIIPAFNAEAEIGRCLDSILNQTIHDYIEIILIDDGSKDNTFKILQQYQKNYPMQIKVLRQENSGPSAARNRGLEIASGKYIGFCDSDDYIAPTMYEEMLEEMEKPEITLVECGRYNVYENGREKEVINHSEVSGNSLNEDSRVLTQTTAFIWDKLFRKDIIKNYQICFPEDFHYAEDYVFLSKYKYFSHRVTILTKPLCYHLIQNNHSITNVCDERWLDIPKSLAHINDFFIQHSRFDQYNKLLLRQSCGYFTRRIALMKKCKNKKVQMQFVKSFYTYFDFYFPNWKGTLRNFRTKKPKYFRTKLNSMRFYIYTPNRLYRIVSKCYRFILRNTKKLTYNRVYYGFCRKHYSVQKKQALFMSYYGGNLTDSPFYMAKELLARPGYEIYFATRNPYHDKLYLRYQGMEQIKLVRVHSKKFVKILATANYIVNNSRLPEYVNKRPEQVFLNTWHGTPLKKLGREMNHGLKDLGNNQTQFLMSDYLLYPNEYTRRHIMKNFDLDALYTGKVILSGYPRNTVFFDSSEIEQIKRNLGIEGKKIFVYMPTWRGNTIQTADISKYQAEVEEILTALDRELSDDIVVFVKLHQIIMKKVKLGTYNRIRTLHPYLETYQFLNIADALITDYSSVFFDFANTQKEIILFMYDYEEYVDGRGMYFDVNELPFVKIYDLDSLIQYMNTKNKFVVSEEYQKFLDHFSSLESAENTKIVNDIVFEGKEIPDKVIRYRQNYETAHEVIICSNLDTEEKQQEFEIILKHITAETILVFKQKTFTEETERIIRLNQERIPQCLVVPEGMAVSLFGKIAVFLYRRTGLFKHSVKSIYRQELDRILPQINISRLINYTRDRKYMDIESLFTGKGELL